MSLEDRSGPYGEAALAYIKAGWPEALPIWKGGTRDKQPMVKGYHGREGSWPDDTTARMWAGRYARANIALRLPRWVIGLDVDEYDDKHGFDSLCELQDDLGTLPKTFVSTSRTDGVSGIRLFMLPGDYADCAWPSQAAADIEMITWYERYVICGPSVHKSGKVYRWLRNDREVLKIPSPQHMSALPVEWCEYLSGLAGAGNGRWEGAGFDGSARQWLDDYGGGDRCKYVIDVSPRWRWNIRDGGSAHEAAKLVVAQAIKAAAEGHTGINSALWDVRDAFIERVSSRGAGERRRGEQKAISEWRSMIAGAVAKYGGDVADEDFICDELEGFNER